MGEVQILSCEMGPGAGLHLAAAISRSLALALVVGGRPAPDPRRARATLRHLTAPECGQCPFRRTRLLAVGHLLLWPAGISLQIRHVGVPDASDWHLVHQ